MIAYNHYIKFIPELKKNKKLDGSYCDIIIVNESQDNSLMEKMSYKMPFINNQGRNVTLFTERVFGHTQKGQLWAFEVEGVATFFWHSGVLSLKYIKHAHFTERLLEYWCLHIILPIFFTIEEIYDFFHASAVEIEGKPILFVANSFGGKSTMLDFFKNEGHTIISDDKVATYSKDNQIFAVPSHPHHRPYRRTEDLGFFIQNFSNSVKPIYAIFELNSVEPDDSIEITELSGIEKFKSLKYNSEISMPFFEYKTFKYLTQAVKSIPVFQINIPWNLERLTDVHKEIIKHVKNKGK